MGQRWDAPPRKILLVIFSSMNLTERSHSRNPRMHPTPRRTLLHLGKHHAHPKLGANAVRFLHVVDDFDSISFFITPLNTLTTKPIDSSNAILLQKPAQPGDPFSVEDYGVQPVHCVPEAPAPFEYAPVHVFDHRGEEAVFQSVKAMRAESELYHRIKFEL